MALSMFSPTRPRRWSAARRAAVAAVAIGGAIAVLTPPAGADGPTAFSNTAAITIPTDTPAPPTPATPYPSPVTVSGMTGPVSDVDVVLNGFSHGFANDVDVMVVGPTGANVVLLSDAGGPNGFVGATNATVTFDDAAAATFPQSGTITGTASYRPTDTDAGESGVDAFPAPAPTPGAATTLAGAFTGTNPNGTWSLYVIDDATGDSGSISGGWTVIVTTSVVAAATSTVVASTPNPSTTGTSVTFTATVTSSGAPVTTGTVTFTEGATTLAANVAVSASGQATFATDALAEGTHVVTATYNGTAALLTSNGSVTQVVDNATTTPDGDTWCNTGSITVPSSGAATPYPSRITVSGAGPALSLLTVDLVDVAQAAPFDLEVLLVGPAGQNLILMSDAGGSTAASGVDLTFADAAAGPIPAAGPLVSGTFDPSDDDTDGADAALPPPAPAASSATTLATFADTNPNGTWSLYVADDASGDSGSIAEGWCLNVTTPAATATTVTSSLNPSTFGQAVTFTATVTSGGSPVTVGTVDLTEGATTLAAGVALNAAGQATFTTSTLTVGPHVITATYGATPAFATSVGTVTQQVNVVVEADAGGPYAIDEGADLVLDGSGSVGAVTYSWDVNGDGTFGDATGASPTLTWAQLVALGINDGTGTAGTVTLQITNGAVIDTDTATLTVANVVPTATLANDGPVPEGSTATVTFSGQADPSAVDLAALTYSYDFDNDGTFEVADSSAPSATVPASFLAEGPGTLTVRAILEDDDGGSSEYTTTITITNVVPTATLSNDGPVPEGSTATVTFSGQADPSADDLAALTYSYDFDNDGMFEIADSSALSATVPASFLADGPGTLTVRAVVADDDGGSSEYTTTITITNAAPTATIDGPATAVVGTPYTIKVGALDPSPGDLAGTFTYVVDWGDGSAAVSVTGSSDPPVTYTYTGVGTFTVVVTATDADGTTSAPATLTVTVVAQVTPTTPPSTAPPPTSPPGTAVPPVATTMPPNGTLPATGTGLAAPLLVGVGVLLLGAAARLAPRRWRRAAVRP